VDLITLDWETYYDDKYSLTKITTEEYIRSPMFEAIGIGIKVNDRVTDWLSGSHDELYKYMHATYDWDTSAVLAHNNVFDSAILSWLFGLHPRVLFDTLCMARALHGTEVRGSLSFLAEMYKLGQKGTEVVSAKGKHLADFTPEELGKYGDYCINDVELCHQLFQIFMDNGFPKKELKVIDMTLKMFTEPKLVLNDTKLLGHLSKIQQDKSALLSACNVTKSQLMSNPQFAVLLEAEGVEPPTKTSPTTGKETFAFAKSDKGFTDLEQHPNPKVVKLIEARRTLKSTLEETRTQRFLDISKRGPLPAPIKYYAAHTGRWGGFDKVNLQNLPSRGLNGKVLKSCIMAPEGYTLIEADSAQIEARVLAWFAEQHDLVAAFAAGEDVYRSMASDIYKVAEEDVTDSQRFVGKMTILGAGYGMGGPAFKEQLRTMGVEITLQEAYAVIDAYRRKYPRIVALWKDAGVAINGMYQGQSYRIGKAGVVTVEPWNGATIRLPSGLLLQYDDLQAEQGDRGVQFSYKVRAAGRTKLYGGKLVENLCQAIARCIIAEQMLIISKRLPVTLTVHDSSISCVLDKDVPRAVRFVSAAMKFVPKWAEGLPVSGDAHAAKNYAESGGE